MTGGKISRGPRRSNQQTNLWLKLKIFKQEGLQWFTPRLRFAVWRESILTEFFHSHSHICLMDEISFCVDQSSCVHRLHDYANHSGFSCFRHVIVFLCFKSIISISFMCVQSVMVCEWDCVPCTPLLSLSACCVGTDGAVKLLCWPAVHTAPPV